MLLRPYLVALSLILHGGASTAFLIQPLIGTWPPLDSSRLFSSSVIDFQDDSNQFGRGEMHLSAILEEGDVVVYQTGSWFVDGVAVGEDVPPSFEYCSIETIQVVWTHNCEHGVLRGTKVELKEDGTLRVDPSYEQVEFGPEQLLARVPVESIGDTGYRPLVSVGDDLWRDHTLE